VSAKREPNRSASTTGSIAPRRSHLTASAGNPFAIGVFLCAVLIPAALQPPIEHLSERNLLRQALSGTTSPNFPSWLLHGGRIGVVGGGGGVRGAAETNRPRNANCSPTGDFNHCLDRLLSDSIQQGTLYVVPNGRRRTPVSGAPLGSFGSSRPTGETGLQREYHLVSRKPLPPHDSWLLQATSPEGESSTAGRAGVGAHSARAEISKIEPSNMMSLLYPLKRLRTFGVPARWSRISLAVYVSVTPVAVPRAPPPTTDRLRWSTPQTMTFGLPKSPRDPLVPCTNADRPRGIFILLRASL